MLARCGNGKFVGRTRLRAKIMVERRTNVKKIKFFPAPHVEIRVSVTDEMAADLRECR